MMTVALVSFDSPLNTLYPELLEIYARYLYVQLPIVSKHQNIIYKVIIILLVPLVCLYMSSAVIQSVTSILPAYKT